MKIYIVFGETGEYSDRITWPVGAFFDEEKARDRVVAATARANEMAVDDGDGLYYVADGAVNEFDEHMYMQYMGTSYYYETADILDD